ncbi:MAG: hypothetical protein V4773_17760 [Verrucomicrobiota bacterium]
MIAGQSNQWAPAPGKVGPWGQLESSRVFIEPPRDFVLPAFTVPQPLRWEFRGYTSEKLEALWQEAKLTDTQRATLNDPRHRTTESTGIVIAPPHDLVLELTAETRAILYGALAAFPENAIHRDPFRSRTEFVDSWLDDPALAPEVAALTRRLLYRRKNSVLLSDHDLILPLIPTTGERIDFLKTLSRKSAIFVQVHVAPNTDIDTMADYWGSGRRSKDLKPLLHSLAQRPQGGSIDIVHLLPPLPRQLLYTYPTPTGRESDHNRDCHWTSLNFYQPQADDRLANTEFALQTLLNNYRRVDDTPRLGDIVMLVEGGGNGIHSCVYIADNIVFTKNGSSYSVPWLLARLEDVVSFYSLNAQLETRRYRLKTL